MGFFNIFVFISMKIPNTLLQELEAMRKMLTTFNQKNQNFFLHSFQIFFLEHAANLLRLFLSCALNVTLGHEYFHLNITKFGIEKK